MNKPTFKAFWALIPRMRHVLNVGMFCAEGRVLLFPCHNYDVYSDPHSPLFGAKPSA